MGTGEFAGLAAAAFWACSSLFYTRTPLTAWQLNFGKNILASLLLLSHLAIVTSQSGSPLFTADIRTVTALALSSVIGIVIGDTFYFRSLQLLGPSRALVVNTTSPLFATLIGWFVLGERHSWLTLSGILVTLAGVAVVVSERSGCDEDALAAAQQERRSPGGVRSGVIAGLCGAVLNAVGAAFSRLGTSGSAYWNIGGCDPLQATVIRVCVAGLASIITAMAIRTFVVTSQTAFGWKRLRYYLPAVVLGPWMGIWMSQIAYKNALLAVALTLTCTTPLFAIPLSRVVHGTPISIRGLCGTLVALAGVYMTVAG